MDGGVRRRWRKLDAATGKDYAHGDGDAWFDEHHDYAALDGDSERQWEQRHSDGHGAADER